MRTLKLVLLSVALVVGAVGAAELTVRWLNPHEQLGMYLFDPALGFRLTPHYRGEQRVNDVSIPLSFNSWGMRDREYAPRRAGSRRIYVLGDSFMFGYGVPVEASFPKVLERLLREQLGTDDVEVVNGGVPRYGTLQELAFFERTASEVQPDLVLLAMFVSNDVVDNMQFARLDGGGAALWHSARLLSWLRVHSQLLVWARDRHTVLSGRPQMRERNLMGTHALTPPPAVEQGLVVTENAIRELAQAVRRRQMRFALLLIPLATQVSTAGWERELALSGVSTQAYDPRQPNARFAALARREELPVLDLLPVFSAHPEEALYVKLHWNGRGHAVAAAAAADFLVHSNLLDGGSAKGER